MDAELPEVITLRAESPTEIAYDNHVIGKTNDHALRIATMTGSYPWHLHPNSDETFLVVEGRVEIEFEGGSIELGPGQVATVPRGIRHRTRPLSGRSVNLTFELAECATVEG